MHKEFKVFVLKGNMVDRAIGAIFGVAFGGLVKLVVDDILMLVIGAFTGGIDFTQIYVRMCGEPQPTRELVCEAGAISAYVNSTRMVRTKRSLER